MDLKIFPASHLIDEKIYEDGKSYLDFSLFTYIMSKTKIRPRMPFPVASVFRSNFHTITKADYDLIPSADRKIQCIIFYFPTRVFPDNITELNLHQSIVHLAKAMEDIPFIILSDAQNPNYTYRTQKYINFINKSVSQKIKWINVDNSMPNPSFSIWSKDAFLPAYKKGTNIITLLCPDTTIHQANDQDTQLPRALINTESTGQKEEEENAPIDFKIKEHGDIKYDGGNILIGDNFILVGQDTFYHNNDRSTSMINEYLDADRKVITVNGSLTNSPLGITLSGSEQSIFHIDLLISLAGRNPITNNYRLVIGCPQLALTPKEFSNLSLDEQAKVYEELKRMTDGINTTITDLKEKTCKHQQPFEIYRVPFALFYRDHVTKEQLDNHTTKYSAKRLWSWASYNGVVEIDGESKKVWIPSYASDFSSKDWDEVKQKEIVQQYLGKQHPKYGNWLPSFEKIEQETKDVWENLGFKVSLIEGGCHIYSFLSGGLPCIVNCI